MSIYFMDFEGFQSGQTTPVLKELVIISVENPLNPLYFNFMPPMTWDVLDAEQRRNYHYQTSRLHHIQWFEGYARYCKTCLWYHLTLAFPDWQQGIFFVMDRAHGTKIAHLRQEFPQLNIQPYTCVTFRSLPELTEHHKCPYRDHGEHCAYLKCLKLYQHYIHA